MFYEAKETPKMKISPLDSVNLPMATDLQTRIFGTDSENGADLKSSLKPLDSENSEFGFLKYWLGALDGQIVGIVGLYALKNYPNDVWLGWFGVSDEFRGRGFGTQLFDFALDFAKNQGYEHLRLYTGIGKENQNARKLYERKAMRRERYKYKKDYLIYSLNLRGTFVELWADRARV